MKFLISPYKNATLNLALEELLFETKSTDFLLIYINQDAVVVGKHQNAIAEINSRFLEEHKIPVLRRFSGGGTVFHDEGNINLSFITSGEDTLVIDFGKYATPVVNFLQSLNGPASLSNRNDIFIEGKKVSGNAAHARGTRALHHGTLLFDSDLKKLGMGLSGDKDKFKSRAVKSVRSPVTNISTHLDEKISQERFQEELINYLKQAFQISEAFVLDEKIKGRMDELARTKYQSLEWNYGYSPDYKFEVEVDGLHFTAQVKKGIFDTFEFHQPSEMIQQVNALIGKYHTYKVVSSEIPTEFVNQFFAPSK